jgi:Family of unknown function (DUF6338)
MDISSFVIRFIFLIIPGIFSSSLYRVFRGKRAKKDWEDYLEILVFSVFNYVLFEILFCVLGLISFKLLTSFGLNWITESNLPSLEFEALLSFFDEKSIISKAIIVDIVGATLAGFITAILASYVDEHKFLNRIAIYLGASKRYGEENVWYVLHRNQEDHWMTVRDHKAGLSYFGWVENYSDWWNDERELLMERVKVYNNETGEFKYETDNLYILRKSDDLTIEFQWHIKKEPEVNKKQTEEKKENAGK